MLQLHIYFLSKAAVPLLVPLMESKDNQLEQHLISLCDPAHMIQEVWTLNIRKQHMVIEYFSKRINEHLSMFNARKQTCTTITVRGSGGWQAAAPCARHWTIFWNSFFIISASTSDEQTCSIQCKGSINTDLTEAHWVTKKVFKCVHGATLSDQEALPKKGTNALYSLILSLVIQYDVKLTINYFVGWIKRCICMHMCACSPKHNQFFPLILNLCPFILQYKPEWLA